MLGDDGHDDDEDDYVPTSPASAHMSIDGAKTLEPSAKEDLEPVLNLFGADEELTGSLLMVNAEIMKLAGWLGGSPTGCRRERATQARHLVSEVYSAPRATAAPSCCRA